MSHRRLQSHSERLRRQVLRLLAAVVIPTPSLRCIVAWVIPLAVLLLGLHAAVIVQGQQTAAPPAGVEQGNDAGIPPALTHYKGREIAQTMHYLGAPWLVRESREREEDCQQLLKALKLRPGQVVADVGCGNGFYSLQIAKLVSPGGRVLATDIQPEMLDMLKQRADKSKIGNIEPIRGTLIDARLPAGKLDLILLVDVYHEFSHPEHMLRSLRQALKPDGRLALVEFRLEDPEVPIKLLHKMSKAQILKELPPNGFKLAGEYDDLPWQHVMFFQRDDAKR